MRFSYPETAKAPLAVPMVVPPNGVQFTTYDALPGVASDPIVQAKATFPLSSVCFGWMGFEGVLPV